jgi:anti-sigma factor ChrR (cupin superfamily)
LLLAAAQGNQENIHNPKVGISMVSRSICGERGPTYIIVYSHADLIPRENEHTVITHSVHLCDTLLEMARTWEHPLQNMMDGNKHILGSFEVKEMLRGRFSKEG